MIRTATFDDASTISDLAGRIWRICYAPILQPEQIEYMLNALYNTEVLSQLISSVGQHFIIIDDEGEPVGFAAYSFINNSLAKLNKLYVLPEKHGKGFGKALLNEVIHLVKDSGRDLLTLNVNRYNPAFHFYTRENFEIEREEDIPIGPYWMNDYVMRKKI
jgi:GNAT superfamily N-acetyltransferase